MNFQYYLKVNDFFKEVTKEKFFNYIINNPTNYNTFEFSDYNFTFYFDKHFKLIGYKVWLPTTSIIK